MKFSKVFSMFLSTVLVSVPFSFSSFAMDVGENWLCSNCVGVFRGYNAIPLQFDDTCMILPKRVLFLPCGCFECTGCSLVRHLGLDGKFFPSRCNNKHYLHTNGYFSILECLTDEELVNVFKSDINKYIDEKGAFRFSMFFDKHKFLNFRLRSRLKSKLCSMGVILSDDCSILTPSGITLDEIQGKDVKCQYCNESATRQNNNWCYCLPCGCTLCNKCYSIPSAQTSNKQQNIQVTNAVPKPSFYPNFAKILTPCEECTLCITKFPKDFLFLECVPDEILMNSYSNAFKSYNGNLESFFNDYKFNKNLQFRFINKLLSKGEEFSFNGQTFKNGVKVN